ncbi:cytochrome c3 family protein [Pelovirga terrestris]|uniref:Cytochrome c domain-containing protein n=1 Tax=Pelovirga terrestris TaxID=2771352 RepID=A0A8J6ULT6_9BACT|nr:cytochrome c3 family protein [Pelovirga terrestris]MBD1401762.1 hypothetical protein [Pelovirga terrestris]
MVETLGITNCIQCHTSVSDAWLDGRHANANNSPSYHTPDSTCGVCHNKNDDADNMPAAFGISRRDVVSCESCHGGGGAHRGIGLLPYPKPGVDQCAQCHAEVDEVTGELKALRSRSGHTPAGLNVVIDYLSSGHADAPRDRSTRSDAIGCNRCHSDEGAKLYSNLNTITAIENTSNNRGAMPLGLENITSIGCATCHDPHDVSGTKLLLAATADASAQYNTCNHCHAGDNVDLNYHAGHFDDDGLLDRQINDTHYDDPATGYGLAENSIEGYVIRKDAETSCSDCHNVHSGDNTINYQWAKSRHGGNLLQAKMAAAAATPDDEDAVVAAGREDGVGHGWSWTHYDWDAQNRQSCARCHTSTGVANFLDDPNNYVAANNDFSHLEGWENNAGTITSSGQNEMLYCWGCHTSATTGEMRDPGALDFTYTNNATVSYPDSAASNVCIACHTGREIGDSIKEDSSQTGVRSFLNSHYLTAGGILFATGGYEYNRDYTFAANDRHQNIGYGSDVLTGDANFDVAAVSDNYTSGPCVTCHFGSADGSHTISPFTTDPVEGEVLNAVCVTCHTARGVGDSANAWYGKDFTEADFVAGVQGPHKARMLGAQLALQEVLESKGIFTNFSKYPYFFTDANYATGFTDWNSVAEDLGVGLSTDTTGTGWKNVMGAAFNLNLIAHDPGATAHNRRYARRLIYDSIDFMDDGEMNDSTNKTVADQNKAFTTSALGYIGSRP